MRALLSLIIVLTALSAYPRRQQTTIRGRLTSTTEAVRSVPADTITSGLDSILSFAGYDKPLTASRETMHVSNLSDSLTVTSITFEITYLDHKERQLHKRTVTIHYEIPPQQTVMVGFPTWDTQRSFYYRLGAQPRRRATPYTVALTPLSATILPH